MKFVVVACLSLLSLSSFAAEDFSQQNLKRVLKVATCEMKVLEKPIVFGKDLTHARSQLLVFTSHESSSSPRRLKENRRLKIQSVSKKVIQFDDNSILNACALELGKKRCSEGMDKLTLNEIEVKSGNNVKITCKRDAILDI